MSASTFSAYIDVLRPLSGVSSGCTLTGALVNSFGLPSVNGTARGFTGPSGCFFISVRSCLVACSIPILSCRCCTARSACAALATSKSCSMYASNTRARSSSIITTCQSRSAVRSEPRLGASAAKFGWLLTFQLPLDSQNALESRTATLMWYAVGKIHFVVSGSISVSAQWPFLSDPERTIQRDLDIQEYTDPEHDPMIPHTLVLAPGLVVHSLYNGYWFWGRPSVEDLRRDLREVFQEVRPD